jgi:hypothetical protein
VGYLASVLRVQMEKRGLSAADISRKTGLQQSWLSRLLNGIQTYTTHEDFTTLLGCFAKDEHGRPSPEDQAEITAGRMMDHRVGPGAELVKVTVKSPAGGQRQLDPVKISPEAQRAFDFLKLSPDQDRMAPMIINLAKVIGMRETPPT